MLQISKGARQYANPVYLKKLIEAAVSLSNIPIAVHLDHGDTFELCKECIDEGFTSVMIDASHEPFEKNVEITKKVVEYAHKHNCVGRRRTGPCSSARSSTKARKAAAIPHGGHYTHPEEAVKFVKANRRAIRSPSPSAIPTAPTNSRANSISIWNACKAIKKALMDAGLGDYPLVLHGASSVPQGSRRRRSTNTAARWAPTPQACRRRTSKSPAASAAPR